MMRVKFQKTLCAMCLLAICQLTLAGPIQYVSVTGFGVDVDKSQALKKALIQSIEQVNGSVMSSKEMSSIKSLKVDASAEADVVAKDSAGNSKSANAKARLKAEASSEYHSQDISSQTSGVIKSYRISAINPQAHGEVEVVVQASIATLKKAKSKRTKIVVHSASSGGKISSIVADKFNDLLAKSRKFSVLDRKSDAIFAKEVARFKEGGHPDAGVLSTTGEMPDLLAAIDISAVKSDGAAVVTARVKVLDFATQETVYTGSKTMRVNPDDSDRRVSGKLGSSAKSLYKEMLEKIAQPQVIGFSDNQLTLSQGKDFFRKGDEITLVAGVDRAKDPATGEALDWITETIGKAKISFTNHNISTASAKDDILDKVFEYANNGAKILVRTEKRKLKNTPKKLEKEAEDIFKNL